MSLRLRLVALLCSVLALGVLLVSVVTYAALATSMTRRTDDQLRDSRDPVAARLARDGPFGGGFGGRGRDRAPDAAYGEVRDPAGSVVNRTSEAVDLPAELPDSGFATVQDETTGSDYRVLVQALTEDGAELVIALPLADARETLRRLVGIELLVGAAVVALAGAGSWWLVGVGLRPLARVESTAAAIAGGDLARRVPDVNRRTETGRLGASFNTMLDRIEESFSAQRASEERLRRFLADASHELRTPLTSVRGYAELFRRGAAERPEDLARAMRRIEEEAARMGVLVDDLLLLARLDEHRPLDRSTVDVGAQVVDAVEDARVSAPDRRIELEIGGDTHVTGDPGRLREVWGNLLTNAVRHTPAGTPVHVAVHGVDGTVHVAVADEGAGMTPEVRARVFDRFYRADASRDRATGGAGLGLAVVQAVVLAHSGEVEATVAPGGGAMFLVRLPGARRPERDTPEGPGGLQRPAPGAPSNLPGGAQADPSPPTHGEDNQTTPSLRKDHP